jgi:hypothetical protein
MLRVYVIFQVLTAASMKMSSRWDVAPCSLTARRYVRNNGHPQGRRSYLVTRLQDKLLYKGKTRRGRGCLQGGAIPGSGLAPWVAKPLRGISDSRET